MGRLNRIVEIQHQVVQRGSFGGETVSFVELAKVWAERVQVKPAKRFIKRAKRTVNTSQTQFRILRRDDLDETMRLIDDYGVTHGIGGILKNGRQFVTLQLRKAP